MPLEGPSSKSTRMDSKRNFRDGVCLPRTPSKKLDVSTSVHISAWRSLSVQDWSEKMPCYAYAEARHAEARLVM